MNIVYYISSKYLKFKGGERGITVITVIALLSIVISSAAAVVILSTTNGFHYNFMKKLMNRESHLIVQGGQNGVQNYHEQIEKLENIKEVKLVYPYHDLQSLVKSESKTWGVYLKGIPKDLYEKDADFRDMFVQEEGEFDLTEKNSIIIGYNMAINLRVGVGDEVYLTVYDEYMMSVQYKFKVTGIFSGGYAEYDSVLAFVSYEDASEIMRMENPTGIAVKTDDPMNIEQTAEKINRLIPYYPKTWKDLNRNLLINIENEKMLVMIILSFFFIVVAFNILSTMIAMVIDKREEVGILKAMGLQPKDTLSVFMMVGFLIGFVGSLLGSVLGLLITVTLNDILHMIENVINFIRSAAYLIANAVHPVPVPRPFQFFDTSVYYISQFPILIRFTDIVYVILISILLSTLAVIIPARKAARLRPIEVLRND